MRRPDLTEGIMGGWQVIDATPQEASDYLFQCGPAPVEAVRRGTRTCHCIYSLFDINTYLKVNLAWATTWILYLLRLIRILGHSCPTLQAQR